MKTRVNSLNISSFPKILSLKVFVRQLLRSVSGDNLVFYFSTISWLRFQPESAQKSHLSADDFGEIFAFNLIIQNVTHFSFNLFIENFLLGPRKT